jgi:hypothetical protein
VDIILALVVRRGVVLAMNIVVPVPEEPVVICLFSLTMVVVDTILNATIVDAVLNVLKLQIIK